VPVSVNLSSPSFADDGLRHQLEGLMTRYGLDANCLVLEVTESLLMADVERAIARLQELREMGFRVSLDDFGTGYSSLSYLRRFPFDKIKIDRSFVQDTDQGADAVAIVSAICSLARSLGMSTTAEGVETQAQLVAVCAAGCAEVQGYLFSRPGPANAIAALISERPWPTVPAKAHAPSAQGTPCSNDSST